MDIMKDQRLMLERTKRDEDQARFRRELTEIRQLVSDASDALSFDPPCLKAVEQRCSMVLERIKRKIYTLSEEN